MTIPPLLKTDFFLSIKRFCEHLYLFFTLNMLFQDNVKPYLHVKVKVLTLKINTRKILKLSVTGTLIFKKKVVPSLHSSEKSHPLPADVILTILEEAILYAMLKSSNSSNLSSSSSKLVSPFLISK